MTKENDKKMQTQTKLSPKPIKRQSSILDEKSSLLGFPAYNMHTSILVCYYPFEGWIKSVCTMYSKLHYFNLTKYTK